MNLPRRLQAAFTAFVLVTVAVSGSEARMFLPGHEYSRLTKDDLRLLGNEVDKLLDRGKTGSVASWRNEKSGNYGTMELERSFESEGAPCRRIDHVIRFKGDADARPLQFTYCKTAQGWKLAG